MNIFNLPVNFLIIISAKFRNSNYLYNCFLSNPRAIIISDDGHRLSPAMGISHGINFQSLGEKVASTGDFVLLANEVNPVASILKKNNIAVTAIHNHMLTEAPRLFFMHFWAIDKPEHLAQAFRSVLNLAK